MTEEQNIYEAQEQHPEQGNRNLVVRALRHFFGGELLVKLGERRVLKWFVVFLLFGILYIYNSYRIEKKSRKIQELQREIKKMQYEYVEMKSKLMNASRQSSLIESLKNEGIKASKVPPRKLKRNSEQ